MVMQSMSNNITLYGAGGHCKVVVDILQTLGYSIKRIVDDNPLSQSLLNIPMTYPESEFGFTIITIGNCQMRKKIVDRITVKKYVTAIHPSAIIAPNVFIGEGCMIIHGAVIQSRSSIGRHCIINTKAVVEHDSIIHDFVHIASGAIVCGGVEIGECTWLGAGSVVKQGIKIGSNCMIGAGSVVVKDIPDNVIAYGNPCRVIKQNNNIKI